ncbi:MAG: GNAT family N-acetyltransferase [Solirubrobacteraceae bacterium]
MWSARAGAARVGASWHDHPGSPGRLEPLDLNVPERLHRPSFPVGQRGAAAGRVRVAVDVQETPVGFCVVIPASSPVQELDGLFVDPAHLSSGIGRGLVEDAAARASDQGAEALDVTAGPAQGFYERSASNLIGPALSRPLEI